MLGQNVNPAKKVQYQKIPLEIIGIGDATTDRVIELLLKDGGKARIRRDLVEIFGNRAFVPKWLADKIQGVK
jgi:hypothetical protein